MAKQLIKNGRKIKGFTYQDKDGQYWYAFGKPSQDNYMAFACRSHEHGKACIEVPTFNH
jgi:hypothetical protein